MTQSAYVCSCLTRSGWGEARWRGQDDYADGFRGASTFQGPEPSVLDNSRLIGQCRAHSADQPSSLDSFVRTCTVYSHLRSNGFRSAALDIQLMVRWLEARIWHLHRHHGWLQLPPNRGLALGSNQRQALHLLTSRWSNPHDPWKRVDTSSLLSFLLSAFVLNSFRNRDLAEDVQI